MNSTATCYQASSHFNVEHMSDLLGRIIREQTWALNVLQTSHKTPPAVYDRLNQSCADLRSNAQAIEDKKADNEREVANMVRSLETQLADLHATVLISIPHRKPSLWRRIFG